MKKYSLDKSKLVLIVFLLIANVGISINIRESIISDLSIGQIIVLIFLMIEFFKIIISGKIKKEFLILVIVLLPFLIFVFMSDNITQVAESNIPAEWYLLYHTPISNYFQPIKQSIFQIINIFTLLLSYSIGQRVAKHYRDDSMSYLCILSKIGITIQFLLIIYQFFIEKQLRPSGSLGNAQAIGTYILVLLVMILIYSKKKSDKFLYSVLSMIIILISETRSALATLIILILFVLLSVKIKKISILFVILTNFIISVILASNIQIANVIWDFTSNFTSPYTVKMRFLTWNSFYKTLSNNYILGTLGRIPRMSENIIWYFLLPYGFVGLIAFLGFIRSIIKFNNEVVLSIIFIIFLQGLSYYGFMIPPLGYSVFFLLGFFKYKKNPIQKPLVDP